MAAEAEVISNLLGKTLLSLSSWSDCCFLFTVLRMASLAGQCSPAQHHVSTEHPGASLGQQTAGSASMCNMLCPLQGEDLGCLELLFDTDDKDDTFSSPKCTLS